MHVAIISRAVFPWHGYGGLERHVEAQARHLGDAGHRVTLFTQPPHRIRNGAPEGWLAVPYRVIPWPRRSGFVILDRLTNYRIWSRRVAARIHRCLREESIDIVHAHGAAGVGYARSRRAGDPALVLHPHGMEEFKASGWKRAAYAPQRKAVRASAAAAAAVIIPDRAMSEDVVRFLHVSESQARVLPNAIDLPERDALAEDEPRWQRLCSRLRLDSGSRYLLAVGRLEANKGREVLLRAMASLSSRPDKPLSGWTLLLVGSGSQSDRLKAQCSSLDLDASVRFADELDDSDLAACYRRASWFVHPTLYEGSSLVTLEAMAHELPVIASAVGGIPDKVDGNGWLVPPGDVESLAARLAEAFRLEESIRRQWGGVSRARVEESFGWSARTKRLVELYAEVSGQRSAT